MRITAFDLPESREDQNSWLEERLVGTQLGELIAELQVFTPSPEDKLPAGVASKLEGILDSGLRTLDESEFASLLTHPMCLLALQEEILVRGGEYWLRQANSATPTTALQHDISGQWQNLAGELATEPTAERPATAAAKLSNASMLTYALSACAALLLAAGIFSYLNAGSGTWGWQDTAAVAAKADGEYLHALAAQADEWFEKRPRNRSELAARLDELQTGCELLIAKQHPLDKSSQEWLLEKCHAWNAKIKEQQQRLANNEDVLDVLSEADVIVRSLANALRMRGEAIG